MRAFIKTHKTEETYRGESLDGEHDNGFIEPGKATPLISPSVSQETQFASPPAKAGTRNKSTPKRLLLPIKNLFSSPGHSRNNLVLETGDNLNGAIYGASAGRLKMKKTTPKLNAPEDTEEDKGVARSFIGPVDLNEMFNKMSDSPKKKTPDATEAPLLSSLEIDVGDVSFSLIASDSNNCETSQKHIGRDNQELKKAFTSCNFALDVPERPTPQINIESCSLEDPGSESELDASDSSQFSFMRTCEGGRSTSVKYYKSVKKEDEKKKLDTYMNYIVDDMDYDEVNMSDYDFENNGIGEELELELLQDEEVQYNKIFSEEADTNHGDTQSINTNTNEVLVILSPMRDDSFINSSHHQITTRDPASSFTKKPFYLSYHLSISGLERDPTIGDGTPGQRPKLSPNEDILERYCDIENETPQGSPIRTPELLTSDNLELFDLNSPLINGVTVGSNLRHRIPGHKRSEKDVSSSSEINKNFIYRETSSRRSQKGTFGSCSCHKERDVFRKRVIRSFHGSLSEDLNSSIAQKVENMNSPVLRKWQREKSADNSKENTLGLGILCENKTISEVCTLSSEVPKVLGEEEQKELDESDEKVLNIVGEQRKSSLRNDSLDNNDALDSYHEISGILTRIQKTEDTKKSSGEFCDLRKSRKGDNDAKPETTKVTRDSIANMMENLCFLEANTNQSNDQSKRQSIIEIMDTLERLDETNDKIDCQKSMHCSVSLIEQSQKPKRSYDNELSKDTNAQRDDEETPIEDSFEKELKSEWHEELTDKGFHMDKDLIDEANEIPEDSDVSEFDTQSYLSCNDIPPYARSNSFKGKPRKILIDTSLITNRIETPNKTVTIYRAGSLGRNSDVNGSRSRSISRGHSLRSMNSSVVSSQPDSDWISNREDNEASMPTIKSANCPYTYGPNVTIFARSVESLGNNYNLDTITEAESPFIR